MTRATEFLRVMWWRHGPGGHGRQVKAIFTHGMHAGYHMGQGKQTGAMSAARG